MIDTEEIVRSLNLTPEQGTAIHDVIAGADATARIEAVTRAALMTLSHYDALYVAHGIYARVAGMQGELDAYHALLRTAAGASVAVVPSVASPQEADETRVAHFVTFARYGLGGQGADVVLRFSFAESVLRALANTGGTDDEQLDTVLASTPDGVRDLAIAMLNAAGAVANAAQAGG